MVRCSLAFWLVVSSLLGAQSYVSSNETVPICTREFRAAWVACVYNIDWPSKKGLSAASQQAEMRRLLDRMVALRMNAMIFQVRPQADALYQSRIEPWSPWLTGKMGRSPGYDPLAYCIQQAHARGIEVHAWFNPFRAVPNKDHAVSADHVSRTHPRIIRNYRDHKWMDPSSSFTRDRALRVILDVVRRYDIDGVHIDDYFYPYPKTVVQGRAVPTFPDGKSPAQRRNYVNSFVRAMYSQVKSAKPWVRVGISPFGIWRPGVPRGTTAGVDAYEHLAADSRRWLSSGWCDYLSPQLYWRDKSEQSFSLLLKWWREQGARPVWPGIATSRIKSSEDPGRPASEIIKQVQLSRTIGRNYVGHVHWSMKALMQDRGGVNGSLTKQVYNQPALVPPMPWKSKKTPATPTAKVARQKNGVSVTWTRVSGASKYAVQARYGKRWSLLTAVPGTRSSVVLKGTPDAVAVRALDRFGTESSPSVLQKR